MLTQLLSAEAHCLFCLLSGGIAQFILSSAPASSVAHVTMPGTGFLRCQIAQNPLLFTRYYACLQEGQILFEKNIFGGQVWLNFSRNITETQQKVKVTKMPIQTILLPLNPLLACSHPKKGLLGQPIWHRLETRHAVSHPVSFPNYCGPPHGSTSHGKGQWHGPDADQQNGHPKCSPGESWSEPKACRLCWFGMLANGISMPEL